MSADAVVIGAGPNGLAAAVVLARAGLEVELVEAADRIGGAASTLELTGPGFHHDLGSAVHPMALASPFFRWFGIEQSVRFVVPELAFAHPLPSSTGFAYRDLARTASGLGADARAWRGLFGPLAGDPDRIMRLIGGAPLGMARDPLELFAFGRRAGEQGTVAGRLRFRTEEAAALMTGLAAHAVGRIPHPARAGAGVVLGALAHASGWGIPIGGSQAISDALRDDLVAHGGRVTLGERVTALPDARAVFLDLSARDAAAVGGTRFPDAYRRRLQRFRYARGVVKLDLATSAPIPWSDPAIAGASTVHLGGTRAEIAATEAGRPGTPFTLVSQPSLFDPGRAPEGRHVVWAYAHGGDADGIVAAIEQRAPGFRDTILAQHVMTPADLEARDGNLIGGDLGAGTIDLRQLFARPTFSTAPWRTPARGVYLCSASVSPGPGVHGMGGWNAARLALREVFGLPVPE